LRQTDWRDAQNSKHPQLHQTTTDSAGEVVGSLAGNQGF
jgi:hypothetical protein